MGKKSNKISTHWILETRDDFRNFLDETDFPDPQRMGERGPNFRYPEWLIMFIAILSANQRAFKKNPLFPWKTSSVHFLAIS